MIPVRFLLATLTAPLVVCACTPPPLPPLDAHHPASPAAAEAPLPALRAGADTPSSADDAPPHAGHAH